MPRRKCYWTRKLELDLVEFVRQREYIWRPFGNTNHQIQQKYKAYAEFAARLGRGFTARSVRDRWVNIRCTFNHNVRRVEKSKESAKNSSEMFVPCWPLWKPLQFLKEVTKPIYSNCEDGITEDPINIDLKPCSDDLELDIRQRGQRTDRPRKKMKINKRHNYKTKCKQVIDELLQAIKPLQVEHTSNQTYWFFAKHVVERLNSMRKIDAESAAYNILKLLEDYQCKMKTS